jgi:hypothetical protein
MNPLNLIINQIIIYPEAFLSLSLHQFLDNFEKTIQKYEDILFFSPNIS